MTQISKTEKIYLTYKTRMLSESRLIGQHEFLNFLLSWYSFWLICFGLAQIAGFFTSVNTAIILTAASIAIFGLSLYGTGQKYRERADQFKACYLQLKRIYESNDNDDKKMKEYHEVLKLHENQTDSDYDEMVFNALIRGNHLYNEKGQIRLNWAIISYALIHKSLRYGMRLLLIVFIPGILYASINLVDSKSVQPQNEGTVGVEPTPRQS